MTVEIELTKKQFHRIFIIVRDVVPLNGYMKDGNELCVRSHYLDYLQEWLSVMKEDVTNKSFSIDQDLWDLLAPYTYLFSGTLSLPTTIRFVII